MPAKKAASVKKTSAKATGTTTPKPTGAEKANAVARTRKPRRTIEAHLSRRTITIKRATEQEITSLVGPGAFSAFAQIALEHQLQRKRIDDWLVEQETARGGEPLSTAALTFAEKAWQRRK